MKKLEFIREPEDLGDVFLLSKYVFMNILEFFDNDVEKADFWMVSSNLNFGGASPIKLINSGRYEKLLLWINSSFKEDY